MLPESVMEMEIGLFLLTNGLFDYFQLIADFVHATIHIENKCKEDKPNDSVRGNEKLHDCTYCYERMFCEAMFQVRRSRRAETRSTSHSRRIRLASSAM